MCRSTGGEARIAPVPIRHVAFHGELQDYVLHPRYVCSSHVTPVIVQAQWFATIGDWTYNFAVLYHWILQQRLPESTQFVVQTEGLALPLWINRTLTTISRHPVTTWEEWSARSKECFETVIVAKIYAQSYDTKVRRPADALRVLFLYS